MRFDEKSFFEQAIIIIISTFTRDQIGINFPYQEKPNNIKQNQQTFFFLMFLKTNLVQENFAQSILFHYGHFTIQIKRKRKIYMSPHYTGKFCYTHSPYAILG